jgi:ribonuclease inhibitor
VKIRFTSSSLRVRITPNELERIKNREKLELSFGILGGWKFALEPDEQTKLETRDGVVVFDLSATDAEILAEPTREGLYFESEGVRFFVEKDFPCEHPRTNLEEEATGTFARTHAGIEIDVGEVETTRALHVLLRERLDFPEFYGHNWGAFWDAITGLVEIPSRIKFLNWEKLEQRLNFDARMLRQCLNDLSKTHNCEIEYA